MSPCLRSSPSWGLVIKIQISNIRTISHQSESVPGMKTFELESSLRCESTREYRIIFYWLGESVLSACVTLWAGSEQARHPVNQQSVWGWGDITIARAPRETAGSVDMRGSSQWWECCETHTHLRSSTRNSSTVCPDWHRVRLTVLLNSFHQVWSANFPCYGQLVVVGEVWVVPPLSCTHHLTITTTGPLLLPPPSSLLSEPDLSLIQSVCCLDVPYNWHSWELLSWLTGCLWRSCRPSVVTQQYTKSCRPSALQL